MILFETTTPDTLKTYFVNGLLKSIDNGTSNSDFAYNNRNELTSETQTLAARPARVVSYSYDADGLRTGLVYPSARLVDLAWTARAQLLSVSADGPPPLGIYNYDKAGRITSLTHENGISEVKSYNAANELLANSHFLNGTASVASLGGSTTTYTTNSANQYLSITGFTPISHDANGNLLLQNNVSYAWDSENRLLAVTPNTPAIGEKSLVHTYDGQHRRVTRSIREWTSSGWSNIGTLHFIYDGWNVIEEYSLNASNSTLVRNLTWGQDLGGTSTLQGAGGVGGLIMVEELNGPTTAYHFHYDGNGNVTEITDNTGSKAATYRYDAFGNTLVATGPYAAQNRYRFSTKPLDSEVVNAPLYYYGYRYYDPTTGRWPSRDPIEEEGGENLYGMVLNDPVNLVDVLGLYQDEAGNEKSGPPCCKGKPGVEWATDDAGKRCCKDEITKIQLRVRASFTLGWKDPGHAFIHTPSITSGFYPIVHAPTAQGDIRDDSKTRYTKYVPYNVCPETLEPIEDYMKQGSTDGTYDILNDRDNWNCVGWACAVISNSGLTPPVHPRKFAAKPGDIK